MRLMAIAVLAALMLMAQPDAFAPLLGTWEGEWKINQGTVDIAGKFRVTFSNATPMPEGRFMNLELIRTRLDGKPSTDKAKLDRREYKVEKLQAVSTDPPRYRWFAAGNCWNVEVKAGEMEGFFNAGPCAAMGMGAGARAIEFVAKKGN
jgi:hypothetical protein